MPQDAQQGDQQHSMTREGAHFLSVLAWTLVTASPAPVLPRIELEWKQPESGPAWPQGSTHVKSLSSRQPFNLSMTAPTSSVPRRVEITPSSGIFRSWTLQEVNKNEAVSCRFGCSQYNVRIYT
eukprot:4250124-Amphidinium_carterae.3